MQTRTLSCPRKLRPARLKELSRRSRGGDREASLWHTLQAGVVRLTVVLLNNCLEIADSQMWGVIHFM